MPSGSLDHTERLADVQAHLAAAREPHASGPGADAASLRTAYLELLKLALCDLAGTSTISVGAVEDGTVVSRELRGDGRRLRAAGMDWPLQGLTMVGLGRLDDLQACVESVVEDQIDGDVIEAGAWRGGASMLMRATLDTLGDGRTVWVADSFQGFPDDEARDAGDLDLSAFDFLAAPLEDVRGSFARLGLDRGVEFVPGFFAQTLPALTGRRWAIVRLDADTYEPTRLALECLYPGLATGGYLILDDYGSFEGCRRAVDEFRREHGITDPIERVDSTCSRWRRTSEAPPLEPAPAPARSAAVAPSSRSRDEVHVPSTHEVELERQLRALSQRLAGAEKVIAHLESSPLRGPRAWARQRLGRRAAR
jgi:O-methyltransferase